MPITPRCPGRSPLPVSASAAQRSPPLPLRLRWDGLGFIASALAVAGVVATAGVSMFPFLLPSSLDPRSSLTVWDASSSRATLFNMLVAAVIFVPVVIAYTAFVYRVLRGRVSEAQVSADHSSY